MSTLTELLLAKDIRTRGTSCEPLFCAADVARYVDDKHYLRTLKAYTEAYTRRELVADAQGRVREMHFFTEKGLYKYLLQSRCPRAEPFQSHVYDILVAERKRAIDKAQLEAKIARDALKGATEQLSETAKELKELRQAKAQREGFQLKEGTTYDDYVDWCLARLEEEHPLVAPTRFSKAEHHILSYYFVKGYYMDGYADIREICLEGIEEPQPKLFRQVASQREGAPKGE